MIKEKKIIDDSTIRIKLLWIKTKEPEKFINELEKLCKCFCDDSNYFFNFSVEE